ncbi:MAG TPA: M28 family metallopeptidase [Terriglobales bacterium]|nr:M28 family metallopeptidase [Terriglobales bacterium]
MILSLVLCTWFANRAAAQSSHFDGKSWWDHVKVLADDKMEGRETGSAGLLHAEAYVVEQLKAAGLQPAGTKGFYQSVKFVSRQIVEKESSAMLVRDGKAQPLVLGEDAIFSTRVDLAPNLEAPLVFAGYGLDIPEKNYNDLAGLDLKGKVVVYLTGSPADVPSALSAHYQSAAERWKALKQAGAIGAITIPNPSSMDIPWSRIAVNRTHPSMALADPKLDDTTGEKFSMMFNPAKADLLFAGSGHTFQEIADLGKDRRPLPHFELPASIRARATMDVKEITSSNIVAKLPGSDSKLKDTYVVLSAHVDHVGIGQPINGDRIYNGAMDNASGTAVLLDVAAELKKSGDKLKRSLLFVFVTGEEKGLLGSQYFAAYPTVDAKSMVADINIDMFLPIVPLKVLTVYGLAESDLGDDVRAAAEKQGVRVQPDPQPLRNVFIRSDQYNFIKRGIPSLMMDVSFDPGTPEQETFHKWRTDRYHAPSDDLQQPVDLQAAAKYEEIVRDLMVRTANDDHRPEWKADSFFRRYAGAH